MNSSCEIIWKMPAVLGRLIFQMANESMNAGDDVAMRHFRFPVAFRLPFSIFRIEGKSFGRRETTRATTGGQRCHVRTAN